MNLFEKIKINKNKGGKFVIVPYPKLKENIDLLVCMIKPGVTLEDLYNVVVKYASKAADEYQNGEMLHDENCVLMRAKDNTETIFKEVNTMLGIDMRQVEIRILAEEIIFFAEEMVKEYIKEHDFFKRYIVSMREYPETDVIYALTIVAFMTYSHIIWALSFCGKEINEKSVTNMFLNQHCSYEYFYWKIDSIATHYRRYISENAIEQGDI